MKYLGYIQFIVLVLFIWLGWQIIDRITFREEMITPLGAALQSAKNNRKELEKVLRHYQKNPADSLKYQGERSITCTSYYSLYFFNPNDFISYFLVP